MGCGLSRGPANGSGKVDKLVTTHLPACPYLCKRVRTKVRISGVVLGDVTTQAGA